MNSIVLNHNISFIRNMKGYQFPKTLSSEDREELNNLLLNKVKTLFKEEDFIIYNLKNIEKLTKNIMVERDIIPDDAYDNDAYVVTIGNELNIEINIYDHLRLSIANNDVNIMRDYHKVRSILKEFESVLPFSYDLMFGYRTANIMHSGNGMHSYFIVHLPIVPQKDIQWIKKYVQALGFTMYSYFRHMQKSFYVIQTEISREKSPDILAKLIQVITYFEDYEQQQKEKLINHTLKKDKLLREIEDFKSLSTISENKGIAMISKIFLANDLGLIKANIHHPYFDVLKNIRKFSIRNYKKMHDLKINDEEIRAQIIKNFLEREDRYVQQF